MTHQIMFYIYNTPLLQFSFSRTRMETRATHLPNTMAVSHRRREPYELAPTTYI